MTDTSREAVERLADDIEPRDNYVRGSCPRCEEYDFPELKPVSATLRALLAERDRLRDALLRIASPDYGLQGMIEDGVATPKNKAAYYEVQVRRRQNIAHDALKGGEDE